VLLGTAETLYGTTISYGAYLLLHFPVLGLLKAGLIAELLCRLFPGTAERRQVAGEQAASRWTAAERRLLGIMVAALLLWATDWLHGISPGWVALAAALLCLLPGVGVLNPQAFQTRTHFGSFFYVAGVLGIVRLIDQSGLAAVLGQELRGWVPLEPDAAASNFAALVGVASLTSLITALAGVPAVLSPLAQPMADAAGLSLLAVLMTQVVAFSALLLPYQVPPLMVALQLAGISLGTASRITIALGLLTLLILAPLDYLWWRWLGYLG